jgi:hypothetical protein
MTVSPNCLTYSILEEVLRMTSCNSQISLISGTLTEIKYFRRTAVCAFFDHKWKEGILEELKLEPVDRIYDDTNKIIYNI